MNETFAQILHMAIHGKRPRVKKWIVVKPSYNRDANGRFTGGLKRKGYTRRILDRNDLVSNMEIMAENITANNALLKRIMR